MKLPLRLTKHQRTAVLAVVAAATFVYAAVRFFDVPAAEMLEYFWLSLGLLGVVMVLAAALVALLQLWRR